jgi:hypothetical protein
MPLIIPSNSISAVGYDVDNSLRFDSGSNDSLTRTPTSGNRKTLTYSIWIKISEPESIADCFLSHSDGTSSNDFLIQIEPDSRLLVLARSGGSGQISLYTNRLFRDVSAWYHIVVAVDTTQATESDRVKIYVNGVQETSFQASTYPTLNADLSVNNASYTSFVGELRSGINNFNGYMAEVFLIDGQQLDATSFGEFDEDTGIWKPIDVSGLTFGTNGFYLDFENSGSLGADVSGNGNNFTVNNLTSIDQSTDTPTNNYATLNPLLDVYNPAIFSNGNLTATGSGSGNARYAFSSIAVANGKWYYEVKVTVSGSNPYVGLIDAQSTLRRNSIYFVDSASGTNQSGYAVNMSGDIYHNNSNSYATNIGSISTGDILGFAIDLDSGTKTCEIYKNGTSQRSFNLDEPTSGFYLLGASSTYNLSSAVADMNFGSPAYAISSGNSDGNGYGNFEYSVPSGYYALNTKNLAEYG